MEKRKIKNKNGFTLIEVMIAISIFSIFAAVFVTGQGYNLIDSSNFKDDIILKDLCENKINEIITNPPEFRDSLTITKEVKDVEGNSNYSYSVEYKKFFIPDMKKIVGENEDNKEEENNQNQLEKRIFGIFKENMEKMIWQVEVTVKNKSTDSKFTLTHWLYNQNAQVKIDGI